MAQITVVYKDFEEMKAVARELLKGEQAAPAQEQTAVPVQSTPACQPAPAAPAPSPAAPAPSPAAPVQQAVPTTAPSYTREDLSRAAITLMDKGQQAQLQQLVQSFGVNSLMELPPEQYGNFATALRGMGAEI